VGEALPSFALEVFKFSATGIWKICKCIDFFICRT